MKVVDACRLRSIHLAYSKQCYTIYIQIVIKFVPKFHYSIFILWRSKFLTDPVSQSVHLCKVWQEACLFPIHVLLHTVLYSTHPRIAETIQAETDYGTDVTKDHLHANNAPEQI